MADAVIDVRNVEKVFGGRVHALRGVDLRVSAGEIFGLLGPNGAGKSTLVKVLLTIVKPTRVEGTLLGGRIGDRDRLAHVGYLPENLRFPSHLNGRQTLDFYAALAKVPQSIRRRRADELLDVVGMRDWAGTPVNRYSKGMLQRLGIAQSLMNNPRLVILDEPTDGLDPLGRRAVRQMLTDLKKRGTTVFINSHILSELEMICDRVSILVQGRVAREGTIAELTEQTVTYRLVIHGPLDGLAGEIATRGGKLVDNVITIGGRDALIVNEIIDVVRSRGILIESVTPQRFSLEDVFVQAVEAQPGGAAVGARA
jgi:ABC-2 type transport system ATP-binding protein